jgi:hypothetical protein
MAEHLKKAEVSAAIQDHFALYGPRLWKKIIDRFPEVAEPTIWRWIRDIKAAGQTPEHLAGAKAKILARTAGMVNTASERAAARDTSSIARHIPASPSPAYISEAGAEGLQNLDIVLEINHLYRDAKMLRDYGVAVLADGVEKVKNPMAFEKSIFARTRLIDTAIRATQEIWDLRRQQEFYDEIIEAIGIESPTCQQRIMKRLAILDAKRGMTTAARF